MVVRVWYPVHMVGPARSTHVLPSFDIASPEQILSVGMRNELPRVAGVPPLARSLRSPVGGRSRPADRRGPMRDALTSRHCFGKLVAHPVGELMVFRYSVGAEPHTHEKHVRRVVR